MKKIALNLSCGLLSSFFLQISYVSYAQNLDKQKLDSFFETLESNNKFMGSVSVLQNGKVLYTKSTGFADIESGVRASEATKYRIGSVSKTFTAVLILKAIEEKKLTLNQNIAKYFPNVKNAQKITIQHLLSHRSGIYDFTRNVEAYLKFYKEPKSEKELVEIISGGESEFEPDTKFSYCNSNYVLLSYILEKVYKKTYQEILKEKIIKPLGLNNTYFGGKINTKNKDANSYVFMQKWIKEGETDASVPMGAGGLVSNPSDLNIFIEKLFAGKIISTGSLEQMKTLRDNYGFGLFAVPLGTKKGYGHNGRIDAFESNLFYFPEDKVSLAITSNGGSYEINKIAVAVLSVVFNMPFELPDFKRALVKDEDLDAYLGVYASKEMPLKITITKENGLLKAQATGQSAFELEPAGKDIFEFEEAGIELAFKPKEKQMTLKQQGRSFLFTKE